MHADAEAVERQQYLSFRLAGGDYAVPILKVREILQVDAITPVPGTPPSIRGVINLRGSVVPVIDLAAKFGLAATAATRWTCILVIEISRGDGHTILGILADAVSEVIALGPEDVEEPPSFGTGVRLDYLLGMGKVERSFVLLLDIERVLSADEKELAPAVAGGAGRKGAGGDGPAPGAAAAPDAAIAAEAPPA